MAQHERAGTTAQPQDLVDVARLVTAYYTEHPDPDDGGRPDHAPPSRLVLIVHPPTVPQAPVRCSDTRACPDAPTARSSPRG